MIQIDILPLPTLKVLRTIAQPNYKPSPNRHTKTSNHQYTSPPSQVVICTPPVPLSGAQPVRPTHPKDQPRICASTALNQPRLPCAP
ncbi:hypothetical protein HBI25_202420 [Parastagonospora nodorum]|nr:hypothetical protein HBH43_188890 [Parastagonospora nodorum]KAH4184454.1 hypothetical protein HBH42_190210 [Parastagonospora nodorum]KAH5110599.1 hypothetical protein HBH71_173260 [Parastagonospora nodorum]KAH5343677.1 hypothetical protein HBI48_213040 [Parastagonospora nodorum]KAH5464069.1 hypothetical protein HBI31_207610 [Parastagonospora nodorum]